MLHKPKLILAVLALGLFAQSLQANPTGAAVVSGSASFAQPSADVLNVTNSHNAIINWQSFNIGAGQTTNFIQPSSNSAVLNQVLSNNPSQIHGNLNSNGKVFVINQHGLMIGAGAQINTAGFYGSTLNITNEDFLNGRLKFEGGGLGGIQNYGYIHAGEGGNVVLIAPDIENGGVIEVDGGSVILAAGESITITSLNDASVEFELQSEDDSIINLGEIIANQGAVGLFAGNLKHSGAINATGLVRNADGSISLVAQQDIEVTEMATLNTDGGEGGSIRVQSHHGDVYFSGSASAQGASESGGHIEILGDRVGLFGAAEVNASGQSGGGEVLIGGDFQGRGETQTATQTQVAIEAHIHADAIESGDGGKVIVWADDYTLFQGEATARGGSESGDGGFLEISGKQTLAFDGRVDASAAHGEAGSVLFDPLNITIETPGTTTLPSNPYLFTTDLGQSVVIDPLAITNITDLGTAVVLQADLDITINDAIITAEGGAGGDITLQAGQSIIINADIFTDNGNLKLYANAAGADFTNRSGGGQANIVVDPLSAVIPPITLDAGTGTMELWMDVGVAGTSGNITVENLVADHILIKHNGITAGGSILQNAGSLIDALSLFIDHDGPLNGTVGSLGQALNVRVDNLGAHIHEPTTNGIYIDATSVGGTVTIGNTCYGAGLIPCNTFGPHLVRGLETILGGGFIALSVVGDLLVAEQIRADDVQGSGNLGDISLAASGTIISDSNIFNNVSGGVIDFNSAFNILLNSGTYGGTITAASTGIPQINGAVTFDKVILDSDAVVFDANTLTLIDSLDIASGRVLVLGSTGTPTTLTTASPTVALNGPGVLTLGGISANNQIVVAANTIFTIGAGMTITGQGVIDASDPSSALVNNGSIFSAGSGLTLGASTWNNNGSVTAANLSILTLVGATLINDGSMTVEAGSFIDTLGQNFINGPSAFFEGSGVVNLGTATFDNQGTVSPGIGINNTGTLTINGNYTSSSTSLINIELQGTSPGGPGPGFHDQLAISGNATLDGILNVSYIGGYLPTILDTFRVMTYTSLSPSPAIAINTPANFDLAAPGAGFVELVFNSAAAGFLWDGGGDGISWNDRFNWSGDTTPSIADDVSIGSFNINVALGGDANSLSLAAGGSLDLNGGTLTLNALNLSGGLIVQSGATLQVQNGAQVNDLLVNASGALLVNGGTLNSLGGSLFNGSFTQLSGNSSFSGTSSFPGAFTLSGGNITFSRQADLRNTNNLWTGGSILGTGPLVLAGTPGSTTLVLSGVNDKVLDSTTLLMNLNDVNVFGSGNLVLANAATIDNTGGQSFNHFGNGDIIGAGSLINNGGVFNNLSGDTAIGVDFINDPTSVVNLLAGTLLLQDPGTDPGVYNIAPAAVLQVDTDRTFTGLFNSAGTVHVSGAATATMNGPAFSTSNLILSGSGGLAGIAPVTVRSGFLWAGGSIANPALTTSPGSNMTITAANVTLPAISSINGSVGLLGATLNLGTNTLQLNNGAALAGTGVVNGDVVNNSGFLLTGGLGTIGALRITGSYTQNPTGVMVVEVFNNGVSTVSDVLRVDGLATLGGTLVIGFVTNSLGLVTGNFVPFVFPGGVAGSFSRVIDAGGNILGLSVNGAVVTILGVNPEVPKELIQALIDFIVDKEKREQAIRDNKAQAEKVIDEILDEEAEGEDNLLVCK